MAPISNVTSGYAPSDGTDIFYECAGDGPALMFVHAGVSDRRMWDPQFEHFADRYRVIRYDHRGFGKSKMGNGPYSLRGDLRNVLKHLGIETAALVGCSMGGGAAIDFALENTESVSALVLVGTGVAGFQWTEQTIAHFSELMRLTQAGSIDQARELDAHFWLDGPAREPARVDPVYRERARQLHAENFPPVVLLTPEQPLVPPAIERPGEIQVPTRVVIGDQDADDLKTIARLLAEKIPRARLVTMADSAHVPNLEHPDEFNRILSEFLQEKAHT